MVADKTMRLLKFLILFVISFYFVFVRYNSHDQFWNREVCKTKKIEINGLITGYGGHNQYQEISVDNLNLSVSVMFKRFKIKSNCPFLIDYEVGDSIIKKKNSNIVTIKRGACKTEYTLMCE
jgi:hypothetical protein